MERDDMLRFLERTHKEMDAKYRETQEWMSVSTMAAPIFYRHMTYECDCWKDVLLSDGTHTVDIPGEYSGVCLAALQIYESAMDRLSVK